ncbi:MAG: hypothetical protein ACRDSR_00890 [Pseudonocardiaceae bacterium]
MDDLHGVGMVGPLGPYARGFAVELARLGFTRGSAQRQMGLAAHLSRWLCDAGLGVAVSEETLSRFKDYHLGQFESTKHA